MICQKNWHPSTNLRISPRSICTIDNSSTFGTFDRIAEVIDIEVADEWAEDAKVAWLDEYEAPVDEAIKSISISFLCFTCFLFIKQAFVFVDPLLARS
jgi:hypothetical protein